MLATLLLLGSLTSPTKGRYVRGKARRGAEISVKLLWCINHNVDKRMLSDAVMFHDANKQPGVCFLSALDPRSSGLSIGSTSIIQQYHVFMYAVILLTGRRAHYCFMFPVGSLCKVQTRGNSLLLSV